MVRLDRRFPRSAGTCVWGILFSEDSDLSRVHFFASLLILAMAAGCKAQSAAPPTDAALARRIEVMVRSKFSVPPDYNVLLGPRKPSNVPGYDSMTVMLARNGKSTDVDFLIATDNSKLARLET